MNQSWKISARAPRKMVQAALLAHEEAIEWPPDIGLSGSEISGDRPEEWVLEAFLPRRPGTADQDAFRALFTGSQPRLKIERLPETDWVTLSQQEMEPISVGPFHIHTPDYPPLDEPGIIDFTIPASRAFGTGQHETTSGCLAMLGAMKERGCVIRNIADIGTGTGLLAFAALTLWPRALAIASDIDPVCAGVVAENAAANGVSIGERPGALTMVVAAGMDDRLLQARAPYDLLIANILAGPLVELAEDFARATLPGGNLLLAGLLEAQEQTIRTAYRRAGFRLAARMVNGDWSVLWLRRRALAMPRAASPGKLPPWARAW